MNKISKIPLETRLKRISRGYASDDAYNLCIVQKMADIPIQIYLKDFASEYSKLRELLGFKEMERVTYKDVAIKIDTLQKLPDIFLKEYIKKESVRILSLPFLYCYERRFRIYEKYKKN